MGGKIVNLRQARKNRDRETAAAKAAENRSKFGRTRAERAEDEAAEARAKREAKRLEHHKLDAPTSPPSDKCS